MLLTKKFQIQKISENNESTTQNVDIAFQLQVIGHQLELLSRTYKDLKDKVNSIKKQNSRAYHRRNRICMAERNVISNFEEFVDENADAGEEYHDFASTSQGIRSRLNRARRKVNYHGIENYEDIDGD